MHPLLRAAAERQLGLVTATDARRAGYQHDEIRRLCSSGAWQRLRRGVYVPSEMFATAEERGHAHQVECMAVLLELDRSTAVLSHESAARLWGVPVRRRLIGPVRLTDPALSRRGRGYQITQAPLRVGETAAPGPAPPDVAGAHPARLCTPVGARRCRRRPGRRTARWRRHDDAAGRGRGAAERMAPRTPGCTSRRALRRAR